MSTKKPLTSKQRLGLLKRYVRTSFKHYLLNNPVLIENFGLTLIDDIRGSKAFQNVRMTYGAEMEILSEIRSLIEVVQQYYLSKKPDEALSFIVETPLFEEIDPQRTDGLKI